MISMRLGAEALSHPYVNLSATEWRRYWVETPDNKSYYSDFEELDVDGISVNEHNPKVLEAGYRLSDGLSSG